VRLGTPRDSKNYARQKISGVEVYIPEEFFPPNPLVIEVRSFLGFKYLDIEGWRPV